LPVTGYRSPIADYRLPIANYQLPIQAMKNVAIMILGLAMQTYGAKLDEEQEVLMLAADILIDTYAAESATLRAIASGQAGHASALLQSDAAAVLTHDAALRIDARARTALAAMSSGDELKTMMAALRRVLKIEPVNTIAARRRVADAIVGKTGYCF
jgi:hypothetical protein